MYILTGWVKKYMHVRINKWQRVPQGAITSLRVQYTLLAIAGCSDFSDHSLQGQLTARGSRSKPRAGSDNSGR